jgi:hypothetical protein
MRMEHSPTERTEVADTATVRAKGLVDKISNLPRFDGIRFKRKHEGR